jgi:TFIIF-interacting CTD phosphatase-like protein
LALDGSLLKTSIYKDELPRVDGFFIYSKLKIYVCFRKRMIEFLRALQEKFEIIAWQSSQKDYAQSIIELIEAQGINFSYSLSIED